MNQKNTLIILSPGFAANEEDTTCLPPQQVFVKALNKNFPSLQIIILAFQYPLVKKHYKWFGNDIISFNGGDKGKLSRLVLWLHVYRTLRKLMRGNNIIGLLSFWCAECALVGKKFSKKYNLKHISWILGQDAKKNNKYVRWIKPDPDELIALSDFVAMEFFKNHQVKPVYVIPNGVDTTLFCKQEQPRTIDIMGAGSLISLKQYDVFVEVVVAVKKIVPSVKAVLCGAGSEEKKLKEMAQVYGLEETIIFMEKKPHVEVLQLMQRSKIFLHPSSYEGFSTVCLEALYAGAHVISFIKPMHHKIQNWHIVKTKEEMIEKAVRLFSDGDTEYVKVLPYSMDDNAKEMMKLFGYGE